MTEVKMSLNVRIPDKFTVTLIEDSVVVNRTYEKVVYPARDNATMFVCTTTKDPDYNGVLTQEEAALIFLNCAGLYRYKLGTNRRSLAIGSVDFDGRFYDYGFDIVE